MNRRRLVWVLMLGCIIAATAHAQWFEGTWAFPDSMGSLSSVDYIVPNPLTDRVYASDGDAVVAFDAATLQKVWKLDFPGKPFYCPGIDRLYFIDTLALVIDAHTDSVIGTARLFGRRPDELAYSSLSHKLYTPQLDTGNTLVIAVADVDLDSVVARLPGWSSAAGMAWDSLTDRLFVSDYDSSRIGVIDCETDTVIAWIALSRTCYWLKVSPVSRRVFAGSTTGVIDIIDADSLRVVGSIEQASNDVPIIWSPVTDRLYVPDSDTLVIIDCESGVVRARVPMADDVASLCANTLSGRVYVGDDSPFMTVLDTSDAVVDSITLGPDDYLDEPAFSSRRNELYSAVSSENVAVIDATVDTVKTTIDYNALSFYEMVFNPAGSKLYVVSSSPDELVVISSNGQMIRTLPMRASASTVLHLDYEQNRLCVVEYGHLRVIDCNTDSVVEDVAVADIDKGLLVQPNASKLYVFPFSSTSGGFIRVYDCYRDTVVGTVNVGDDVPCATYLPTTNCVYFAKHGSSFLYTLDVQRDSVVDSVSVGRISGHGQLLADARGGLLYVLADAADSLCIVDARQDSVILALPVPPGLDTMLLSEASNKLYLANRAAGGPTYVFDLNSNMITDSMPCGPSRIGMVDERNNKLYLASSSAMTVVDCRYDSVVTVLPSGGSMIRGMAWDPVNNRVFAGGGPTISVYGDDPYAVEEGAGAAVRFAVALRANPVRGSASFRCTVPAGEKAMLVVRDVLGTQVAAMDVSGGRETVNLTWAGTDARGHRLAAGVYFAQLVAGKDRATVKVVLE